MATSLNNFVLIAIIILLITLLICFLYYISSINKLYKFVKDLNREKENIIWPHFFNRKLSFIADNIYEVYKYYLEGKTRTNKDRLILQNILEMLDEGVLLINEENKIVHYNSWLSKKFKLSSKNNIYLLESTNNIALIDLFTDLINLKKVCKINRKIDEKVFEIVVQPIDSNKLITFHDITDALSYEKYKYDLTGNITHELKTPVSLIMNYAETLIINKDLDDNTKLKFLNTIFRATERLNNLINDIAQLHKIESMVDTFQNEEVSECNIEEAIDELIDYYKIETTRTIDFKNTIKVCHIKLEHIISILTNLINNAIKYTNGSVLVNIKRDDRQIIISVEDQGPQILDDDKTRIFERFYTTSHSKDMQSKGTGLGLSIVKHIAKLYNGNVHLEKNKKGGNTFIVELIEK